MTNCTICFDSFSDDTWSSLFYIGKPTPLCANCTQSLEKIQGRICDACGRPLKDLAEEFIHQDICFDCVRWLEDPRWVDVLKSNRSVYVYNDFMKETLSKYKFRGDHEISISFRKDLTQTFKQYFSSSMVIVPIPLSQERLYERGFNQSLVFAEFLGPPQDILTRIHHEKQSKKSRVKRIEAENVFKMKEEVDLKGKGILLIDDIYTTGSTIRHAAKVLLSANAESVSSLTLVRS
jgi:competence protein ComFC